MLEINCSGCVGCCSNKLPLTPVLWPGEEHSFRDDSRRIDTPHGIGYLLKRKENGNCIFLDEKHEKCTVYHARPAECQLYPLLLDLSSFPKVGAKLDRRFCPNLNSLSLNNESVEKFLSKFTFTEQFKNIYESLPNC